MEREHIRVLLVDDDRVDQMAVVRFVKDQDLPYDVETSGSRAEAEKHLAHGGFDVVLTDYELGDGTGLDLLPKAGETPTIFVTGRGNEGVAVKAIQLGAYDYLIKDLERSYLKLLPATIRSVLARRQAEVALRDSQRRVQEAQKLESLAVLAGGIAHEVNNLLVSVLGNADLALAELSQASEARENLERILTSSKSAAKLCQQLLAYSGGGRFLIEPVGFPELVKGLQPRLRRTLPDHARLVLDLQPTEDRIEGDTGQLRQLVSNLVTNAAEAMTGPEGEIRVRSGVLEADREQLAAMSVDGELAAGRYAFLEVSDTGGGLDEEARRRMFEPFYSTKMTGRGLGLAAVLGIVRGHGGAIDVDSRPGIGTTIRVLLPVIEEAVPEASTKPATAAGGGTVLLIDSDPSVQTITRSLLEELGFEVLLAAGGGEGLELFRRHAQRVAAVLLDATRPTTASERIFHQLRRIEPAVRVVLTSGYDELEIAQDGDWQGLAGFVQKPYGKSDLRAVLERLAGAAGP